MSWLSRNAAAETINAVLGDFADDSAQAKAVELDIEGIVAKRLDAPYSAGRQLAWLKIKNRKLFAPGSAALPLSLSGVLVFGANAEPRIPQVRRMPPADRRQLTAARSLRTRDR
jgi:hypothetical protein